MHPYLTRLGIRSEVQTFFQPYYTSDSAGNLIFSYHDVIEHYGFAFHKVPESERFWLAGNNNFNMIREVFICGSAMDAIAWLSLNFAAFKNTNNLLFLSIGVMPCTEQINWLNQNLIGKTTSLIFSNDLLGRVCDLKIAAGISRMPVAVTIAGDNSVQVNFRFNNYVFQEDQFSLNAIEKKSGYRFNVRTQKPKGFHCYLDQLKANAFQSS